MTPRVVAIDGPAGSGKSTLARALALRLGLPYVNTGAMYRALTLEAQRRRVDLDDEHGLTLLMETLDFTLSPSDPRELWIEGEPPSRALEAPEVETHVSTVARHPRVRQAMRIAQRALGEDGAVMEGRDIGSVVFPDAAVKIYLLAAPAERAGRRAEERSGVEAPAGALHERDRKDAAVNPFVPTADAVEIDTSALDADATLRRALAVVAAGAPDLLDGGTAP